MTEYVLYIRSKTGAIERKSSYPIFWCYEWLVPYAHEEPLIGWPESKVFRHLCLKVPLVSDLNRFQVIWVFWQILL